jgi:hypothetical protein
LYQDPDHVWPALISLGPSSDSNWVPNLVTRFRQELSGIFKNKTKEYDVYKKRTRNKKLKPKHEIYCIMIFFQYFIYDF